MYLHYEKIKRWEWNLSNKERSEGNIREIENVTIPGSNWYKLVYNLQKLKTNKAVTDVT